MKILIVDDNSDDRRILRYMVQRHGHEPVEAADGLEGLQKAKSLAPDAIISDALMPVMDGFQFLREVRQEPTLQAIPFIVYSSSYKGCQDVRLAMSLGADAYFIKPMEPADLWRQIEDLLAKKRTVVPAAPLIQEDAEYLKRYSEVVATQLEEKVGELERTLAERKRAEESLRRSEEHLRSVYENLPVAYQSLDGDGRYVDINPAWSKMTGYAREDVIGRPFVDFLAPGSSDLFAGRFLRFMADGEIHLAEYDFMRKDGTLIAVELNGRAGYDAMGSVKQTYCTLLDITERKRGEQERIAYLKFLESLDRVNRAIQGATDLDSMMGDALGVVLEAFDCDRAFLLYPCDPEATSWAVPMERTRPEYPGVFSQGLTPLMDEEVAATLRAILASDGPVRFGPGTGNDLPREVSERFSYRSLLAMAIYPKVDKPWLFGIHQCSGPRAWTAEEERLFLEVARRLSDALTGLLTHRDLRRSQEFLDNIVENIPNMLFVKDADTLKFVRFNRAGEKLLGYSRDTLLGKSDHDLFPPQEADFFTSRDRQSLTTNELVDIPEETIMTSDNTERILHTRKIPIVDDTGKPRYILGISEDITERKRTAETLRERDAFIRSILESVDEGFIVVDREHRILSANRAFCEMVERTRDDIVGGFCYEAIRHLDQPCFLAGLQCPVNQTFETGAPACVAHMHPTRAGAKSCFEVKSYPILDAAGTVSTVIETVIDVTDRRKLEDQLRQAQKMEAIGQLAGGIAHDFNNILTAILGYTSIVKMRMAPGDPQHASVNQILTCAERAAQLTRGLLAFSRKQVMNPRPADLNTIVKNVQRLLLRLIGEDVNLCTTLANETLIAMADPGQIEQVLMNLATNARDAMPDGGVITIETAEFHVRQDVINGHGLVKPGRYAQITVSDTGTGMDEQTREKIFEPFFTTKGISKGTGLGLSIVYGIVKQHDGVITVYSEPGEGTTFKIYLPLIVTEVDEPSEEALAPPRGGNETILLAEDDAAVRDLTRDCLVDFGYRVIEATDGQDALEKYESRDRSVDLLVLDVIMPRKSGKEVYDAIRSVTPDIDVIFMSGYTADIIHKRGIFDEGLQFIAKPLTPFELLRKVREVLDRRRR